MTETAKNKCSIKICSPKFFKIHRRKIPEQGPFFNKIVRPTASNFIKKDPPTQPFSCEF